MSVSYHNLRPATFLDRTAFVYPDKPAVVYGDRSYTYSELSERVDRLASALSQVGIGRGDRVAFMVPNLPEMLEGHYGPMRLGAVLVAINIRLSAGEIAYILNHSGARVLVFDSEFAPVVRGMMGDIPGVGTIVQVIEGTTGLPKGVEYHARGAYMNALGEAMETGVTWRSNYLWTLPMFHCNGWCFTWGVTAMGGTHFCLRRPDPGDVYRLIEEHGITHMCAAPTVLTSMYSHPGAADQDLSGVTIATAGAPPAPQVIRTVEGMGATIYHAYGLTETYGPHTVCALQPGWDELPADERARLKSRQGVPFVIAGLGMRVVDERMRDVPMDGETMGEVVMQGNNVMTGYFNDPDATAEAFRGGWFHSGDLAVWHPDGYIEVQDRAKDVIISGGENISSQQVEKTIMEHPAVLEVSVVGVPDDRWGEVPKAFVVRRAGQKVDGDEIIRFTRERIAHFKAPKYVEVSELPKTATGKIQKYILRAKEWEGRDRPVQGPV